MFKDHHIFGATGPRLNPFIGLALVFVLFISTILVGLFEINAFQYKSVQTHPAIIGVTLVFVILSILALLITMGIVQWSFSTMNIIFVIFIDNLIMGFLWLVDLSIYTIVYGPYIFGINICHGLDNDPGCSKIKGLYALVFILCITFLMLSAYAGFNYRYYLKTKEVPVPAVAVPRVVEDDFHYFTAEVARRVSRRLSRQQRTQSNMSLSLNLRDITHDGESSTYSSESSTTRVETPTLPPPARHSSNRVVKNHEYGIWENGDGQEIYEMA